MGSMDEYVLLLWFRVTASGTGLFEQWHDREHIPQRLRLPGIFRAERYVNDGGGRYLCCYRLSGPQVLSSPAYLAQNQTPPTALARQVDKVLQLESRKVAYLIANGGRPRRSRFIVAVRLLLPAGDDPRHGLVTALRRRFSLATPGEPGPGHWRMFADDGANDDSNCVLLLGCTDYRHGTQIIAALHSLWSAFPGTIAVDTACYALQAGVSQ